MVVKYYPKSVKLTRTQEALKLLSTMGKVKAYDFALSFWPDKYQSPCDSKTARVAVASGSNFLWRLVKQGYVSSYNKLSDFDGSPLYVWRFGISEKGLAYLSGLGIS